MSSSTLPLRNASTRFDNGLRYRDGDHPSQTQLTPEYVLEPVRADLDASRLVIGLDPCTTSDNPVGAERFYTAVEDGLRCSWSELNQSDDTLSWRPTIFCNPPYGKAREPWVKKCIAAGSRGQRVILLMPAATDTRIFKLAASTSTALVYITGRVKFGTLRPNRRQHAASHPSALIGWNTPLVACSDLGWKAVSA